MGIKSVGTTGYNLNKRKNYISLKHTMDKGYVTLIIDRLKII